MGALIPLRRRKAAGTLSMMSSATSPGPKTVRRLAMDPARRRRGAERIEALRQEPGDQPGEHIAAAGGGKVGRRVGVNDGAAIRRGDDGIGAFEQHHGAALRRGRARPREPVTGER